MVQIVAVNIVLVVVEASHTLEPPGKCVGLAQLCAFHRAKLALADEPFAEVRIECNVVGAKESGESHFIFRRELPQVVDSLDRGVSLVKLAWVDGVTQLHPMPSGTRFPSCDMPQ